MRCSSRKKQADRGDAGGSGVEAGGDGGGGDAAKGKDGGGCGSLGCGRESLKAEAGAHQVAIDALFEDWPEEDEVSAGAVGGMDFGKGVGADAEESARLTSFGEGSAGRGDVPGGPAAGKMEAVGSGLYGQG